MNAACYPGRDTDECQVYPRTGPLARNLNRSLPELQGVLATERGEVYCPVVASTSMRSGQLCHSGSGPNWQGDLITLCTCRWRMRNRAPHYWEDHRWIAGFTSTSQESGCDAQYLLFLMKVDSAYPSQKALWNALAPTVREAKSVEQSPVGDVYRPRPEGGAQDSHNAYFPPMKGHSHRREADDTSWYRDVNDSTGKHRGYSGAPFLMGDPHFSYLWQHPIISRPFEYPRSIPRMSLSEMLGSLR